MIVYRKSIELVRILHQNVMPKLKHQDRELHPQLHRAVRSMALILILILILIRDATH